MHRLPIVLLSAILSACVSSSGAGSTLVLEGSDDIAAASALEGYLRGAGQPVERSSDQLGVFVYRRGMATLLTPVVQSDGFDRIVATRIYGPAPGRGGPELAARAAHLNATRQVGGFS
ncbi:MAG: hypothetical protein WBN31_12510, partial [Gammaproteobacteria bacterium]